MSWPMMTFNDHRLSIMVLILFILIGSINCLHLNGITATPNHPHSDVYLNFFHELIDDIGKVAEFTYQLRIIPEAVYGGNIGESKPTGLIKEIYDNDADFAIADMEITPERSKFVQFTRPYMRSPMAALVERSSLAKKHPADLHKSIAGWRKSRKLLVINGSTVERYFRTSKQPSVYHLLPQTVSNITEGIEMVKSGGYILLSDWARLELVAAFDCQLKVIKASQKKIGEFGSDFMADYGIALSLTSPFFGYFESALRLLEETDNLEALIEQHWYPRCDQRHPSASSSYQMDEIDDNHVAIDQGLISPMPTMLNLVLCCLISIITTTMICWMFFYYDSSSSSSSSSSKLTFS